MDTLFLCHSRKYHFCVILEEKKVMDTLSLSLTHR